MSTELPPTPWVFPDPAEAEGDFVGIGADLEPGTILAAYRSGLFPMPVDGRRIGWWSPDPRGILPLDGLHLSRSLRRSMAGFEVRVDTACPEVIDACADVARSGAWINAEIRQAYVRLHELGWVHSVEAWSLDDGQLAGGLYGVALGGLFAGESMFHHRSDASKVALAALVELLVAGGPRNRLLDVQWRTEHLATLGVVDVSRREYLRRLTLAEPEPLPPAFATRESPRNVGNPPNNRFRS